MNKEWNQFTASLHTHVRSIYDAHIDAKALCARIKELGGKGCAITDHGVLSSIEDYREVFKNNNLKMIPGCELYVDGGILGRLHLIVLAKNDNGYNGISKIVTESNRVLSDEFPVISQDKLFEMVKSYKGDIIALSACMQGVLCAIFLQNKSVNVKIEKLRAKQSRYHSPSDAALVTADEEYEKAKEAYDRAIVKRDDLKRRAEMKFGMREKAIIKLEKANDPTAGISRAKMEADKKLSIDAAKELPKAKEDVAAAKKALSSAEKNKEDAFLSCDKYFEIEEEITALNAELKGEEELYDIAKETALAYSKAFGKACFFAEMQYHGIPDEAICYPKVAKLAKELGIPFVATNDVHILTNSANDRLKRQILRSLRYGKNFEEEKIGDNELFLKDNDELAASLLEILPQDVVIPAIKNIDWIFDRCNVEFCTEKHYPKYSQTEDANVLLDAAIKDGIKRRYPDGMDEEHSKRLEYELSVIKSMGYADYHLVVKDFLEYGRLLGFVPKTMLSQAPLTIPELKEWITVNGWRNQGLMIGPGRGSAVGSLVCYLLGITNLDPIKYGLLFERFLNPERVSMPDIDSDFGNSIRQKVIEYVQNKYGEMAVCGIMTTNAQAPKGCLRIAAKFYGLKNYGEPMTSLGDMIARNVPDDVGTQFDTTVSSSGAVDDESNISLKEYLLSVYSSNPDAREIIEWASIMEGSFTAYGAHAAGIVISDNNDVSDYLPLMMNETLGMFTTQCNMIQVENNGLLKFDFLGLKTLDIITETLRLIENNKGIIIDPLKIDLDDENVYAKILSAGKTNSVFQFESAGMKAMLKRFKPKTFEDLIILVSMFRPGPLQYLDGVIDVKNGKSKIQYLTPELEPILSMTYGAIVYQEQVMRICQDLAGFSLGSADQVRRYMSKKKADKLEHEREAFIYGDSGRNIKGCVANGIDEEAAKTLFDQMMDFARYAFNKSHAAAYSLIAYITAWLKCYYPAEFFASALNWAENDEISGLVYEASDCGVKVLAPDINVSSKEFAVSDGAIRFGIASIAGVKNNADEILKERENGSFSSLKDFCTRIHPKSMVVDHLISAGAFDAFSKNRNSLKTYVKEIKELLTDRNKKTSFIESAEYILPLIEGVSSNEELIELQKNANLSVEFKEKTTA